MARRFTSAAIAVVFGILGTFAPARAQSSGSVAGPEGATLSGPDIIVTARAARLYRVEEATVGRLAADPLEIPQSVTLLNRQLIEDQGARDITELYRNIAGVTFFSYSGVTFRGFRQDEVFYDQLRGDPFAGFTVPQLFTVERVEVLKGPAGMLFGPSAPGGVVNYVSKVPEERRRIAVQGAVGAFDRRGGALEATGPIDPDGVVRMRAAAFHEEQQSFRVNAGLGTTIVDGGLAVQLAPATRILLQATHTDQTAPGNRLRGVPTDNAGRFLADISWNHNEPEDGLTLRATALQGRLESRIADWLSLDLRVRHVESREEQQYHEPFGLIDTDRDGVPDTTRRQFRDQLRTFESQSGSAILLGDLKLGASTHRLLAGVDLGRSDQLFFGRSTTAGVPNLSLRTPVYGLTANLPYRRGARPLGSDGSAVRTGVFLQDQIGLVADRVLIVGGVRHDWFDDRDNLSGRSFAASDTTFRAGVIGRPRPDVSLYASWSTSFEPQAIGNQDPRRGGPFPPQTGEQIELGARTALRGGGLQFAAALYQIRRANLVQVDPSKPPVGGLEQLGAIGEVRSRGLELEAAVDVTPQWVLTANYAYNDTVVTRDNGRNPLANAVGSRFANAPKHQAGFWTRYQVPAIRTAFALGGEYVGERLSLSAQRVRPYAILDASIIHERGPLRLLLRVDNLLDKTYAASGFIDRTGHFPGEPRTLLFEARVTY